VRLITAVLAAVIMAGCTAPQTVAPSSSGDRHSIPGWGASSSTMEGRFWVNRTAGSGDPEGTLGHHCRPGTYSKEPPQVNLTAESQPVPDGYVFRWYDRAQADLRIRTFGGSLGGQGFAPRASLVNITATFDGAALFQIEIVWVVGQPLHVGSVHRETFAYTVTQGNTTYDVVEKFAIHNWGVLPAHVTLRQTPCI
jgi:hypothetical protein